MQTAQARQLLVGNFDPRQEIGLTGALVLHGVGRQICQYAIEFGERPLIKGREFDASALSNANAIDVLGLYFGFDDQSVIFRNDLEEHFSRPDHAADRQHDSGEQDEARTAVRRRTHLTLVRAEESGRVAEDAEQEMLRSERHEAVRMALDRLSERDREVLLFWDAGLSYDEIAEQTGLARGAIGTTLSRARQRLVEAHRMGEDQDATYL